MRLFPDSNGMNRLGRTFRESLATGFLPGKRAVQRRGERISGFRAASIRTRLLGAIGLLAAVALLVVGLGVHAVQQLNQRLQGIVEGTSQRWMLSSEMQCELISLDRDLQRMVLETDPARVTQGNRDIDAGQHQILDHLKQLQALATARDSARLITFSDDFAEYQSLVEQIESDVEQNKRDAARQFALNQGQALFRDASQALNMIGQIAHSEMQEARRQADTSYRQTRDLLLLISAAGIGLGGTLAVLLVGGVLRNLLQVTRRMQEIASGDGDLTRRLPEGGKNEVSDLCRSFNHFLAQIRQIVAQVAESTHRLRQTSESISASMVQQTRGAEVHQRQTTEVAQSIREMAESASSVAAHAQEASDGSGRAAHSAHDGGAVVQQAIQQMRDLATRVDDATERVRQLSRNSEQIGEIIDVIDEIADQTKLLALNAAIEAARAGDHGRGFAVVADAVRSLSDKTSQATHEIAARLKSIHAGALTTVKAMQAGSGLVTQSMETAEQANHALQGILETADGVGAMVHEIAAAAEQQRGRAVQVQMNIEEVARITRESVAATRQVAESCEELSNLSLQLERLIERFHLSETIDEKQIPARVSRNGAKTMPVAAR